jgi:hypothetical protein
VPVDGGAGVVGAAELPLDVPGEPGEETVCEPLQELENCIGFCGCAKSPQ